jgi:hypothetical protein
VALTSTLKAEQELAAVEARRRGDSLDQIAANLGISRTDRRPPGHGRLASNGWH